MAKPDKNKHQRMTDIDFSNPDNHVAIVDKAANGKEKFLVVKALLPGTDYEQREASANSVKVAMPLTELLQIMGIWSWDAMTIAAAIEKSEVDITTEEQLVSLVKSLESSVAGAAKEDGTDSSVSNTTKSEIEDSHMTDDVKNVPVNADQLEAAVKSAVEAQTATLKAQNDELSVTLKAFQAAEAAREDAKFSAIAKNYEGIGATDELGKVLKAISKVEGSELVFALLDGALDAVTKSAAAAEIGTGGTAPEGGFNSMEELQAVAKALREENPLLTVPQSITKAAQVRPDLVK